MQIQALLDFLKKPRYEIDPDPSLRTLGILLKWDLVVSLFLGMLVGLIGNFGPWNPDSHLFEVLFEKYSPIVILIYVVVIAPVIEELIFRGPMWYFRNSRFFGFIFYTFAFAFALVHLGNYSNLSEVWPITLLLISPQFFGGLILGFVRVRFGLIWSISFHMAFNAILILPILLLYSLGLQL